MIKIIKYKNLFMVLEHEYGFIAAIKFINRIRKFSPMLFDALYEYIQNYQIPVVEVRGVSLIELIENEMMSPIMAFITLDWIEKKPMDAFDYMQKYRYSAPLQELSNMQRIMLEERLKELKQKNNIIGPAPEPLIETDLEIDNEKII